MGKEEFDLCGYCCEWFNATDGKSPATVRDTYPKVMRKVLKERFGMPNAAARMFVRDACSGNWERLHETAIEKAASAEDYADALRYDVFYCSDRWSWDRVLRVQWLYKMLCWHARHEEER